MSLTLTLDCGGHGIQALLIDDEAEIVAEAFRPVATRIDGVRVEQEADEILEAMRGVISELVGAADRSIAAAGLAVQRGNVLCWDKHSGDALSPVISWRDRRRSSYFAPDREMCRQIQAASGLRVSPYAGAAKLAWCLEQIETVQAARDRGSLCCGPLGAWLVMQLCGGSAAVDDSLAQRSLLWSRARFDWDEALCRVFAVPRQLLPPVRASRSDFGEIRMGGQSVPLRLLMGDQNVLPYIDGRPDPTCLSINLGTGAFLLRPMSDQHLARRFQLSILDRAGSGVYALEASVHGAASALEWLEQRRGEAIPAEDIDAIAASAGTPPLFLNSIDGLGSPWWQDGPEPAFVGAVENSAAELAAVLESMAFLIRANVDAMSAISGRPERVRVSGGLSRSEQLCRLLASLLGTELLRLRSAEGTALGLWAALRGQAVPGSAFVRVPMASDNSLEQRYQAWLKLMPPLP